MNKKTFDKAVKLAEQINYIEFICRNIKYWHLEFISKNHYSVVSSYAREEMIQDIISKHEAEIRKEIESKYNELKEQIKKL